MVEAVGRAAQPTPVPPARAAAAPAAPVPEAEPAQAGVVDQSTVPPARVAEFADVDLEKLVVPRSTSDDDKAEEIRKLIRLIQAAMTGTLTRGMIKKLLGECHDPAIQSELKAMLAEFDRIDGSHKGMLTREDLKAFLKKSSSPLAALMAQALGI